MPARSPADVPSALAHILSGARAAVVMIVLPIANWIASLVGLPALTEDSAGELYEAIAAVYYAVAAAVPVLVAYWRARSSDAQAGEEQP